MSSDPIRLLVVDAENVREGLVKERVSKLRSVELISIVHNRRAAEQRAKETQPDVVMVDLMLPGLRSINIIESLSEMQPEMRVLAISPGEPVHDRIILALEAGALGYLTRDDSDSEIEAGIQAVHAGKLWLPPETTYEVLRETAPELGISAEDRRNRLTTIVLGLLPAMGLIAALTALLWRKYWGHIGVRVPDLGIDPTTRGTDVLVGLLSLLGVFGPLLFVDRWLQLIGEWIETQPGLANAIARARGIPLGKLLFNRIVAWAALATAVLLFGLFLARFADLILILFVGPAVGVALLASYLGLDDELPRVLQRGRMSRPVMAMLVLLVILFLVVLGGEIWVKGPDLRADGMHGILAPQMLGLSARPMMLYDLDGNLPPLGALYLGGNADLYVLYDPCEETVRLVPVGSSRVEMIDEVDCEAQ